MTLRTLFASTIIAAAVISTGASAEIPDYIAKAVADPSRPADDTKLDADRKPGEVLTYAAIRPREKIAEYLPGGGYYTRMLSDIVGPTGHIYALETICYGKSNEHLGFPGTMTLSASTYMSVLRDIGASV